MGRLFSFGVDRGGPEAGRPFAIGGRTEGPPWAAGPEGRPCGPVDSGGPCGAVETGRAAPVVQGALPRVQVDRGGPCGAALRP